MIMIMNTNNIITVNIHVFNRETNSKDIVKVSVKADNVMELWNKLDGVNGRKLHYLLGRPELFNKIRCFFSCFTEEFKNYLVCEKEIGLWHRFVYDRISLDK